jgi:hypothetical protein
VAPAAQLSSEALVVRNGEALAERVFDETLILDPSTDRCTRLNRSGSLLWEALDAPRTLAELSGRLEQGFGLDPTRAHADAEAFVRQLAARGLVRVRS